MINESACFFGKRDLRLQDIQMPDIKNDYVLVKTHACGVCRTDIHIFDGDEGAAATPAGTVLGHEFSGEVVASGKDVTGIRTGSRVCVDPNVLCGHCENCFSARGHFSEKIIGKADDSSSGCPSPDPCTVHLTEPAALP